MAIQLRITEKSIATRVMAGLQNNLTRLGKLQEQLSSGKQIFRPSDSPTGVLSAMQLRGEMRSVQQYSRNANDGLGWLGTTDTTLTSALDQVRRVRDLTLQGMSSGVAASTSAREALAVEVDNLRTSLIGLANTRYLDRPVFGGTTGLSEAYTSSGAYQGDAGAVERTVADGARVRIDSNGPDVFGTDGDPTHLFTVLQTIADDLRTKPDSLSTDLNNLDTAMNRVQAQLADVGTRYNRVANMYQTAEDRLITLRTQLSDVEDIDLPNTITELQLQNTAYQAALAATAKVVQPSLVDFLR